MFRLLLAFLLAVAPTAALAGATRGKQEMAYIPFLLRGQNCNGIGPCTWSLTKEQIAGNDIATFVMETIGNAALETPVMLCNAGYRTSSTTVISGRLQTCDFSLGVNNCVSVDTAWSKPIAVAIPRVWAWRVDVTGLERLECSYRTFNALPLWNVHGILSTY